MRHWEHHRTRSKVALLLLINLVALLGGKYMALITIVKIELFGEAMAFAKAPKKKPPKPHLSRAQRGHSPPPAITWQRHVERPPQAPLKTRPGFIWPVEGQLTSPFGERGHAMGGGGAQFHAGIDVSVPPGTPVQAAQEGTVAFAGYNGAYGKVVKLDHPHGFSTLYAHNSRLLVYVGQTIAAGQVICLSGSSGRSTGPHLHFEVHKDGWPVDPLPYLE